MGESHRLSNEVRTDVVCSGPWCRDDDAERTLKSECLGKVVTLSREQGAGSTRGCAPPTRDATTDGSFRHKHWSEAEELRRLRALRAAGV